MKHLAALLFLTLAAGPAYAEKASLPIECAPREKVTAGLETWDETPSWRGIHPSGVVELWTAPESFTVTITLPGGLTCMVLAGQGWEDVKPKGQGS